MNSSSQRSNQRQWGLNMTPSRLSRDFSKHKLAKIVADGEASSVMPDSVKRKLHIRREVKQNAFINCALFRFTNGWFEKFHSV
jgi:hypothetical protein